MKLIGACGRSHSWRPRRAASVAMQWQGEGALDDETGIRGIQSE